MADIVQTYDVYPVTGEFLCKSVCGIMIRKTSFHSYIGPYEPYFPARAVYEMISLA